MHRMTEDLERGGDEGEDAVGAPLRVDEIWKFMDDLRAVARGLLSHEQDAFSIRPTALVLSALKRNRPADKPWEEVSWKNQRHFFKVMHTHMVWYLRSHARYRNAQRRPRLVRVEPENIDFFNLPAALDENPEHVVALDEALSWLKRERPELAELVEHRYFSGLTVEEAALLLGISSKTVKRRWREARILLHEEVLKNLNR